MAEQKIVWMIIATAALLGGIFFGMAMLLTGCPTPSPTPVNPAFDASDAAVLPDAGDLADHVCSHLDAIGCAQPLTCEATFRSKQGRFTDFKPDCLLAAQNKTAAQSCGTVVCP